MSKQIELSDKEFELIHHLLNNAICDWKEYNRKCGYDNSLELATESMPSEYELNYVEVDEMICKLLYNQFEL